MAQSTSISTLTSRNACCKRSPGTTAHHPVTLLPSDSMLLADVSASIAVNRDVYCSLAGNGCTTFIYPSPISNCRGEHVLLFRHSSSVLLIIFFFCLVGALLLAFNSSMTLLLILCFLYFLTDTRSNTELSPNV